MADVNATITPNQNLYNEETQKAITDNLLKLTNQQAGTVDQPTLTPEKVNAQMELLKPIYEPQVKAAQEQVGQQWANVGRYISGRNEKAQREAFTKDILPSMVNSAINLAQQGETDKANKLQSSISNYLNIAKTQQTKELQTQSETAAKELQTSAQAVQITLADKNAALQTQLQAGQITNEQYLQSQTANLQTALQDKQITSTEYLAQQNNNLQTQLQEGRITNEQYLQKQDAQLQSDLQSKRITSQEYMAQQSNILQSQIQDKSISSQEAIAKLNTDTDKLIASNQLTYQDKWKANDELLQIALQTNQISATDALATKQATLEKDLQSNTISAESTQAGLNRDLQISLQSNEQGWKTLENESVNGKMVTDPTTGKQVYVPGTQVQLMKEQSTLDMAKQVGDQAYEDKVREIMYTGYDKDGKHYDGYEAAKMKLQDDFDSARLNTQLLTQKEISNADIASREEINAANNQLQKYLTQAEQGYIDITGKYWEGTKAKLMYMENEYTQANMNLQASINVGQSQVATAQQEYLDWLKFTYQKELSNADTQTQKDIVKANNDAAQKRAETPSISYNTNTTSSLGGNTLKDTTPTEVPKVETPYKTTADDNGIPK